MLHIELEPDVEQLLAEAARARGLKVEDYAGELIMAALLPTQNSKLDADAFLRGMLSFAQDTPVLTF